jgi:hypothetical protein
MHCIAGVEAKNMRQGSVSHNTTVTNGLAMTLMMMTTLLLIGTSQLDKHQQKEYLHSLKQCLIQKTS